MPGYEGTGAGVRRDWCRGTKRLVPGYEGTGAGVRETGAGVLRDRHWGTKGQDASVVVIENVHIRGI